MQLVVDLEIKAVLQRDWFWPENELLYNDCKRSYPELSCFVIFGLKLDFERIDTLLVTEKALIGENFGCILNRVTLFMPS